MSWEREDWWAYASRTSSCCGVTAASQSVCGSCTPRDRDAGAEHLRDDVLRDLRGSEPGILEDLLAGRVIDELVRQSELVHRGVDAGFAQHLPNPCADSADPDAVLDRDDETVGCRELDDRRLDGHDPARIDDGRADALRSQSLRDIDRDVGHRSDADDQHVLRVGADEHVDAVAEALQSRQGRGSRSPWGSG